MLKISSVQKGSTGEHVGLHAGDFLVSINDNDVHDVINYRFLVADEHITLAVRTKAGKSDTLSINKDPDDNLGLDFAPFSIKRCRNKCIFCFVDQMPSGCRKSLLIKDDDYRASFLHGNYITLGALTEADWDRIFTERLSPLYVSVHATDPAVRAFILGNSRVQDIVTSMKRLAEGGIIMHAQVVLCPGINDGEILQRTLNDLASLFPAVASIALVPVGLTNMRRALFPLRSYSKKEAQKVVHAANDFGDRWNRKYGTRLVFPSDEFYIKSGMPIPAYSYYEDFPQIENGIGMVADFLRGVQRTKLRVHDSTVSMTVVTGVSFSGILKKVVEKLSSDTGARIKMVTAKNKFFGPSVTVAGLLTGGDILSAVHGQRLGDVLVVPASALKQDENIFLDDMKLDYLSSRISIPVVKAVQFHDLTAFLKKNRTAGLRGGP